MYLCIKDICGTLYFEFWKSDEIVYLELCKKGYMRVYLEFLLCVGNVFRFRLIF